MWPDHARRVPWTGCPWRPLWMPIVRMHALAVLLSVLMVSAPCVRAQGLVRPPSNNAGSSREKSAIMNVWKLAERYRYTAARGGAAACSKGTGFLCGRLGRTEEGALWMASAPTQFDARNEYSVGKVGNQGSCNTCVAFAVLGALQAAVSAAVGRKLEPDSSLSVQKLHFCASSITRECSVGWMMKSALEEARALHEADALVSETCLPYAPDKPQNDWCATICSKAFPDLYLGSLQIKQLADPWLMQQHIRVHGSIMCSMELYQTPNGELELRQLNDAGAGGVYNKSATGAAQLHAVQVVGYDNDRRAWLVKNSWGTDWGDKGFFWVAFGAAGICPPDDTWGWSFKLDKRPPDMWQTYNLRQVARSSPCWEYVTRQGDHMAGVAHKFGLDLRRLLLDNLNTTQQEQSYALRSGIRLKLCDVLTPYRPRGTPGAQMAALMDIKAALWRPVPAVLPRPQGMYDWEPSRAAAANGGFCQWSGVTCVADSKTYSVRRLSLGDSSSFIGTLPRCEDVLFELKDLEELLIRQNLGLVATLPSDWHLCFSIQRMYLWGNRLQGTLPAAWGGMRQLVILDLSENRLNGPLPPDWVGMVDLQELRLHNNQMNGSLPDAWGNWTSMKDMQLSDNQLSGTLPPSWGKLPALESLNLRANKLKGPLPAAWGAMRTLTKLSVSNNNLTGALPAQWAGMAALKLFRVASNNVTGQLPGAWGNSWRNVEVIGLQNNLLTGTLPPSWWGMRMLINLSLANNTGLTGSVPPSWGQLRALKEVDLQGTPRLSGCLPSSWRRVAKLNVNGSGIRGFCS